MKKLQFQINIIATSKKVWQTLWFSQSYKKWTTVFCEGSYYKGEMKEGNRIHFLSPDGRGMYSHVESFIPNEYAAFKHLGDLSNFEELPQENFQWSGSTETYKLQEENGITTLTAILDAVPEFEDCFNTTFPKALQVIKELAEKPASITIETTVNCDIDKIWKYFTEAHHIKNWYNASPDWHTPIAENDLQFGGEFNYRMEAKDGSFGFNFTGSFTLVDVNKTINYTMDDGRKASINFIENENGVTIIETFDAEEENTYELQQMGWQAILNNFKNYTQTN